MKVLILRTNVSTALVSPRAISRILVLFALAFLVTGSAAFAIPDKDPCSFVHALRAGQVQVTSAQSEEADIIAIEVAEAGWLALQSEPAGAGEVGTAWLELVDSPCRAGERRVYPVGDFLEHGMVEVTEPGTVYLKMGSVVRDPAVSSELRLATHLFPNSDRMPWAKDGEDGSDTEEVEDEILPFLFPGNGCVTQAYTVNAQSGDPRSKDGEDGSDTEEVEDEILPLFFPGNGCVTQAYFASEQGRDPRNKDGEDGSDTEEVEDEILPLLYPGGRSLFECEGTEPMNDLRACAAHVGLDLRVEGRLDSLSNLDRDYYAFSLGELRRVRLLGSGASDLVGSLFDAHGRLLLTHGLHQDGFIIEANLAAGRYFLRVEGYGEGEYQVHFGK